MFRKTRNAVLAVACAIGAVSVSASFVSADEIQFNNGDKLTGKIVDLGGGKLKIKSAVAGEVTVDVKDVKTFSTEAPVTVRLTDGTESKQVVAAGADGQIAVGGAQGKAVPLAQVKQINPNEKFTGSLVAGGLLARGNTDVDQLNVQFDIGRRTTTDRITAGAGYLFGRQRDQSTGDKSTTTDNWFVFGKYDYFFNEKLYAFGAARYEKDRIAGLDRRITPSAGIGYQFIESPKLNFNAEAGIAYVLEQYTDGGNDDHLAARLAYHVDYKVNDKVDLFHNLVYLPGLDRLDNYNLIADAGVRATIVENFFTEFKLEWRYDSTPAPGASSSDLRYILGVGWKF